MIAICVISCYLLFFLGSINPMHARISIALLGIACVLIACAAGYGLSIGLGWGMTEMMGALPTIMLGIGVDDMFVICSSLDQ